MFAWRDFFELVGVLFGIYGVLRFCIWFGLRDDFGRALESRSSNLDSHPIDTTQLEQTLEKVRQNYVEEARAHPANVGKPYLVEERRAEIAKLAFFQKPSVDPELPEKSPGVPLMLAF